MKVDKTNSNYQNFVDYMTLINDHDGGDKRGAWPLDKSKGKQRVCIMDYPSFYEENGYTITSDDLWKEQGDIRFSHTGHIYQTVCD